MRVVKRWWGVGVALLAAGVSGCAGGARYIVSVPVADLRAQPGSVFTPGHHDPLQETQLLYGEQVRLTTAGEDWLFVEAVEQAEYTHAGKWQGYPGWIEKDAARPRPRRFHPNAVVTAKWAPVWNDAGGIRSTIQVPMGAQVAVTPTLGPLWMIRLVNGQLGWISQGAVELRAASRRWSVDQKRRAILRAAEQFIGDPYVWGGRSPFVGPGHPRVTGVDCSGLVNLAYRAAGITVPRDAHEQYLRAKKISTLQPADLIFLSKPDDPSTIVHVTLYAGDDALIEGPGTGLSVRRLPAAQRLGRSLDEIRAGETVERQTVYFGAYLP